MDAQRVGGRLPEAAARGGEPDPLTNEAFHAPGHGHCEPDYHWPARRVIVELDGFETHGTRAAFRADRAKDAALTAAGYRVLRFTRDDDPELAVKRLRALLAWLSAWASPGSSCPRAPPPSCPGPCRAP
jgi:Protein of unknown function (DUF559)